LELGLTAVLDDFENLVVSLYAVHNNTLAAGRLRLILRAAQRADRETVRQQSGPNEVLCTAYIARPELCKSAGSC
jgi:hypothetical protein